MNYPLRARSSALALPVMLVLPVMAALACGDSGRATGDSVTESSNSSVTVTVGSSTGDTGTPTGEPTSTESPTGSVSATDGATVTSEPTTVDPSASATTEDVSATATDTNATESTGPMTCLDGQIVCEGNVAKTCDGMGGFKSEEVCDGVCAPDLGCSFCVPGTTTCEGEQVFQCNAMGDGTEPLETCDPLLGLSCDVNVGACVGACAGLGLSYIGCEYYPTVLQQFEGYAQAPAFEYAVAIANTSAEVAKVTVTQGPNMITQVDVAANSVQVVVLPWVNALAQGFAGSNVVIDGAYHLRSTRPITVYQYNPLTVTQTNDASLLLPVNTWTGNYLVASWPTWPFGGQFLPGLYAVVAQEDGTTVTLKPSTTGKIVKPGGNVAADGSGVVVLDEGDVLQVFSDANGDVTGSIVAADKPVQVFGGHKCTNVPLNITACDHLEESMFPIETLAKEYVVVPPVQFPNNNLDKGQIVRVIASEDNTTLVFTPDQPVGKLLAKAGDFVELPATTNKFVVTGDKKILVAQYMVGQDGGYGTSDPAMLVTVNPQQWRKSYLFHAPTLWQANFVDILAPLNATVTVDGAPVAGWQPVAATNYQVAHVSLANVNNGNHSVVGDVGVGIGVYGVLNYGSYWYPGGLDLDVLPQ